MHPSVLNFTQGVVDELGLAEHSVLEVGSLNVNGSTRGIFKGPYHGIDMRDGRDVDEVLLARHVGDVRPGQFDVVVCTEMLEHDETPWLSLASMRLAARPGGVLILTARGFDERGCFPLHDFPSDLYRFSCDGMRALLEHTGWTVLRVERDPEHPGAFAVAQTDTPLDAKEPHRGIR